MLMLESNQLYIGIWGSVSKVFSFILINEFSYERYVVILRIIETYFEL